jgi:hypothetical protein
MKAWHFLREGGQLQWRCGRVRKPKVGQTLKINPDKLELCRYGLHASVRIIDALEYAPGPVICRVEMGGRIIRGDDKLVASERTIIAMADATEALHLMACWSARRALKLIANPDPRSIAAIEAKERWLRGALSNAGLATARAAACAAASAATRDAARDVAWAAEHAAAWAAARAATWATTWATANAAERAAQNRKLTAMATKLLGD